MFLFHLSAADCWTLRMARQREREREREHDRSPGAGSPCSHSPTERKKERDHVLPIEEEDHVLACKPDFTTVTIFLFFERHVSSSVTGVIMLHHLSFIMRVICLHLSSCCMLLGGQYLKALNTLMFNLLDPHFVSSLLIIFLL